jgi:hypothetical protein
VHVEREGGKERGRGVEGWRNLVLEHAELIVHVDDSLTPVGGAKLWGGAQPYLLMPLCVIRRYRA